MMAVMKSRPLGVSADRFIDGDMEEIVGFRGPQRSALIYLPGSVLT